MTTQTDVHDLLRRLNSIIAARPLPAGLLPEELATIQEAHAYLNSLKQGPEVHRITLKPEMYYDGSVLASRLDSLEAKVEAARNDFEAGAKGAATAYHNDMTFLRGRVERIEKVLRRVILEGLHKHEGETIYALADSLLRDFAPPSNKEDNDGQG